MGLATVNTPRNFAFAEFADRHGVLHGSHERRRAAVEARNTFVEQLSFGIGELRNLGLQL